MLKLQVCSSCSLLRKAPFEVITSPTIDISCPAQFGSNRFSFEICLLNIGLTGIYQNLILLFKTARLRPYCKNASPEGVAFLTVFILFIWGFHRFQN